MVEYFCSLCSNNDELILKKNKVGKTALHYASNSEIAKLLVESVTPNRQKDLVLSAYKYQCTALHEPAAMGRTDVVDYLCSLYSPNDELILKQNSDGSTALHYAKTEAIAKLLIESISSERQIDSISFVTSLQFTALHTAVALDKVDVVKYLLRLLPTYNHLAATKNSDGCTALHSATNRNIAELLVESIMPDKRSEFVKSVDNNQCTALYRAAATGRADIVEYLCSLYPGDSEFLLMKDSEGSTPLHIAINREIAKLLVESVDANSQKNLVFSVNENDCTALHVAAAYGKADIVEYLCSLYPRDDKLVQMKASNGWKALHFASRKGIAKVLVESVRPNRQKEYLLSTDNNGFTALHVSAAEGKTGIVEYLCELFSNNDDLIYSQDKNGLTALHIAYNKKVVEILLTSQLHGQTVKKLITCEDQEGNTPILSLIRFGKFNALDGFLSR